MELLRALGSLIEEPRQEHRVVAEALGLPAPPPAPDYEHVIGFQRYPLASVYLGPEGMIGGVARDRIAGFWRALRVDVPEESDHLSTLLGLLASTFEWADEESDEATRLLWERAKGTLFHEHLASWLEPYLLTFDACGSDFYEGWARLTRRALAEVAEQLPPADRIPAHLVEAPPIDDPRGDGGGKSFLDGLLAPARSGWILLREDLARASDDMGAAFRAGERRYALSALFSQDPVGTLEWLAAEGRRWTADLTASRMFGATSDWWIARASATTALLGDLAVDPRAVEVPEVAR